MPKDTSPTVKLHTSSPRNIQGKPTRRQKADLPPGLHRCDSGHSMENFWALRGNSCLHQIEPRFYAPGKCPTTCGASASRPECARHLLTTSPRRNRTSARPETDSFLVVPDTDSSSSEPFFAMTLDLFTCSLPNSLALLLSSSALASSHSLNVHPT